MYLVKLHLFTDFMVPNTDIASAIRGQASMNKQTAFCGSFAMAWPVSTHSDGHGNLLVFSIKLLVYSIKPHAVSVCGWFRLNVSYAKNSQYNNNQKN